MFSFEGAVRAYPGRYIKPYADVAQLAEQLTCNQQVIGSSPIIGLFSFGWIPERPKGADCKSVAIASKVRILLRPYFILTQSRAVR